MRDKMTTRVKRKEQTGICVYCGQSGHVTEDHVIPRCLFVQPYPSDIPRVPACRVCNNDQQSQDDSYLRDALICIYEAYRHPIAQELFGGKFTRAVQQGKSAFARDALRARPVSVYTSSGLFVETAYAFDIPAERLTRIITRIVRGLHCAFLHEPLVEGAQIEIHRPRDLAMAEQAALDLNRKGAPYVRVGDGKVFSCLYARTADRPDVSLWFLIFYESIVFTAVVNGPDSREQSA
jgi:hypothetical protein